MKRKSTILFFLTADVAFNLFILPALLIVLSTKVQQNGEYESPIFSTSVQMKIKKKPP